MQLTKIRAAPERQAEVPPCAPAGESNEGTASQLVRRVMPRATPLFEVFRAMKTADNHGEIESA
jgi:hypothetical protein